MGVALLPAWLLGFSTVPEPLRTSPGLGLAAWRRGLAQQEATPQPLKPQDCRRPLQQRAVLTELPASASSAAPSAAGSWCHGVSSQDELVLQQPNFSSSFPKGGCLAAIDGHSLCQDLHGNQGPQLPALGDYPERAPLAGLPCRLQWG